MEPFVLAPFILIGMFGAFVPLILIGLIIYFLIQIKRALEDLSLEVRDTREAIRDAAGMLSQSSGPPSTP